MIKNIVKRTRKQSGLSTIILAVVIAFFAVLPLSMLGFELSRMFLAQEQLQHVLDCAALAGTAALAQSPSTSTTGTAYTVTQQQTFAMNAAVANFMQQSILQTNFGTGNVQYYLNTTPPGTPPAIHNAVISIQLQNQTGVAQTTGSLTATTMKISAAYTEAPIFGAGMLNPLGSQYTVNAYAVGGLPQLDIVLCFDTSGSMDDSTPVYFVNRYWNGTQVHYALVNPAGLSYAALPSSPTAAQLQNQATIYNMTQPGMTGTSLNASQPQNLSFANYSASNPLIFSEGPGSKSVGLRANMSKAIGSTPPERGAPPGNYDPKNPATVNGNGINPTASTNGFTDMVSANSIYGTNYQWAVEASRGNMTDAATLKASQGGSISPELTGYTLSSTCYSDYWNSVNNTVLPMSVARTAAVGFFNIMNTSTNAHFSLVTFSTVPGTSTTSVYTDATNNPNNENTDKNWTGGGVGSYPLPMVPLNLTATDQLTPVVNAIQGTSGTPVVAPINATGQTDIADSLTTALTQLTDPTKYRPSAKRAIILFTDGIPNQPSGETSLGPMAIAVAKKCAKAGIGVWTIGLSTNPLITVDEQKVLGDNSSNAPYQGITYWSNQPNNIATYTPVSNPASLQAAFQQIARQLVVLQGQAN
jgi:hypothetical protein